MKLNECEKGSTYFVHRVLVAEAIGRRLEALGVNEGTEITVLNKKGSGSVIVKVRGTRLAMGRKIAEGIEAEKERAASHLEFADGRGGRR
ncbi:MAG: ferrous iron transport protein A [Lachnospiraceae bacterium]|nr:ferrous iron transport protein A [Lachnospiraceae bacterium]